MKRDNQKLAESCKRLKDENKDLLQKVKELESSKHDLGVKLAQNTHQLDKTNTFLEKLTRSVFYWLILLKTYFAYSLRIVFIMVSLEVNRRRLTQEQ